MRLQRSHATSEHRCSAHEIFTFTFTDAPHAPMRQVRRNSGKAYLARSTQYADPLTGPPQYRIRIQLHNTQYIYAMRNTQAYSQYPQYAIRNTRQNPIRYVNIRQHFCRGPLPGYPFLVRKPSSSRNAETLQLDLWVGTSLRSCPTRMALGPCSQQTKALFSSELVHHIWGKGTSRKTLWMDGIGRRRQQIRLCTL